MGAHAAQGLDTCPGGDAPSGDASALWVTQSTEKKQGSPCPTNTCASTLGCPSEGQGSVHCLPLTGRQVGGSLPLPMGVLPGGGGLEIRGVGPHRHQQIVSTS